MTLNFRGPLSREHALRPHHHRGLAASPQVPVPHHLACPEQPLHLRVATLGVTYTVRIGRVGSTTKAASSHSSGPVPALPQALSIYPCLLMRSLAA